LKPVTLRQLLVTLFIAFYQTVTADRLDRPMNRERNLTVTVRFETVTGDDISLDLGGANNG